MPYKLTFQDGSSAYLAHYGVKGMHWGVRRYQNYDRTLTAEGKKHDALRRKRDSAMSSTEAANSIVRSLSPKERELLGAEENSEWIDPKHNRETSENVAKRVVVNDRVSGKPASFFEIWDDQTDVGQVAIATDATARGKGYASEAVKKGMDWYDRYGKDRLKRVEWIAEKDNEASINLAKKHGFEEVEMTKYHPNWGGYDDYRLLVYSGKNAVDKVLATTKKKQ